MNKVTFELEGQEYKIPTHLTINDYVKVFKVKDLFEDDYFAAKLISIITGADMTKLLEADREKVGYVFEQIYKILPLDKPGFLDKFTLDGVEYGFIPSWKKMSFGEFADLDTLMTKKPDEVLDYLHIITAILYRPITKSKSKHNFEIEKYNQNTMEERSELFKNKLDIEVALGAQFFFTQFARIYSNYTPISLKMWMKISWIQLSVVWKMRKLIWKRIVLRKDLDGLSFSTEFAQMILQDIQKLLIKQS
jgi:hypothetical protein